MRTAKTVEEPAENRKGARKTVTSGGLKTGKATNSAKKYGAHNTGIKRGQERTAARPTTKTKQDGRTHRTRSLQQNFKFRLPVRSRASCPDDLTSRAPTSWAGKRIVPWPLGRNTRRLFLCSWHPCAGLQCVAIAQWRCSGGLSGGTIAIVPPSPPHRLCPHRRPMAAFFCRKAGLR